MKIELQKLNSSPNTTTPADAQHRVEFQPRPSKKIHQAGHGFRATTDRQEISRRKTSARLVALLRLKALTAKNQAPPRVLTPQATPEVWLVALGQLFSTEEKINAQPEDSQSEESDPG